MPHLRSSLALAALAALLSACGGGGGGSSPIPSSGGSGTQPAQTSPANLVIVIPPASQQNTHFRPTYISAGTQSMTVGLVTGTSTTPLATVNLTTGSPNCTVPTGGGLQCTATVQAPFGTDTFLVSTYSGLNGGGTLLSTGQVKVTLTSGAAPPTVALSLDGVPHTVSLVLGTTALPVGTAGSTAVIVQASDASGNLIIGPGLFSTPITLTVSGDTYNTLKLSNTSVTSPGQVVTLSYNGNTNVGSTITPTGSGLSGASVSFNATGAVLTLFQYYDATNGVYGYPQDVAAFPTGTPGYAGEAAVLMELFSTPNDSEYYGIGVASPAGVKQTFVGDTSDPYNLPAPGSLTIPGVIVVHGMSSGLDNEVLDAYDDIAASSGAYVFYSGYFTTESGTSCPEEETETSGTIGALNPTNGTTTEHVLLGYPAAIRVDSAGNVWFIESSGDCDEESPLIGGNGYAIGEWKDAPIGPVTETLFNAAGLGSIGYPSDMSISADGSAMFIADENKSTISKIKTAPFSSLPALTLTNSLYPEAIATANDAAQTTAWWSDNDPLDNYFYGYVSGTAFSTVAEATFPINYFYSFDMSYADGSFWVAGAEDATGIGRVSGLSAGSPVNGYYAMPTSSEGDDDCGGYQNVQSISSASGSVWAVDDDCNNFDILQYGEPSNGTVTYTAVRHIGATNTRRNPHPLTSHHAVNRRAHARPH